MYVLNIIYSLIDWMTWIDLRNTFMWYVIIGPIYPFVWYEMKTKRLVRVDPLNLQIRKPKTRFNLKMAIAYSGFHETMTLTSLCENTEKRTIVYKVTAKNKE